MTNPGLTKRTAALLALTLSACTGGLSASGLEQGSIPPDASAIALDASRLEPDAAALAVPDAYVPPMAMNLCAMPRPEGAPTPAPLAAYSGGACPSLGAGPNTLTSSGAIRSFIVVVPSDVRADEGACRSRSSGTRSDRTRTSS